MGRDPLGRPPRRSDRLWHTVAVPEFHFVVLNVAQLHHSLESAESSEFVKALDPINALAESSPGFVWRLQDDDGQSSSYVVVYDDPLMILNLSVWESPDAIKQYVYRSEHNTYLRRRREWFQPRGDRIDIACWWTPVGRHPTATEATDRLDHLRANGPSDVAFPLNDQRARFPGGVPPAEQQ